MNELRLMTSLDHSSILKLLSWYYIPGSLTLVLPHMKAGNLFENVNSFGSFSNKDGRELTFQISDALLYLHSNNIIHRDLKPENVLLVSNLRSELFVKVCDFGLSRRCIKNQPCYTIVGTFQYMAPEMHRLRRCSPTCGVGYSFAIDLWSLGILLYAMYTVSLPFEEMDLTTAVLAGNIIFREEEWKELPDGLGVVQKLLRFNPKLRYSSINILKTPCKMVP